MGDGGKLRPLPCPDGRYVSAPTFTKAEELMARGAEPCDLPEGPDLRPPTGKHYVVVVQNRNFDAALVLDRHDLRRVHSALAAGDRRPMQCYLVPSEAIGFGERD